MPELSDRKSLEVHRSFEQARHPLREKARRIFLRDHLPSELRQLVAEPTRILVLGSGDGTEATHLAEAFPGAQVVAIDLSTPEIHNSQKSDHAFALLQADWDHPPFREGVFDLIVGFAALHHAVELPSTAASLARLLRPQGWLYGTHEPLSSLLYGSQQRRHMQTEADHAGGIETSPSFREWTGAFHPPLWKQVRIDAASFNLIRLEGALGFDDVRQRRSAWPERTLAAILRLLPARALKLKIIFWLQRIAIGLFGVTIRAQRSSYVVQ